MWCSAYLELGDEEKDEQKKKLRYGESNPGLLGESELC